MANAVILPEEEIYTLTMETDTLVKLTNDLWASSIINTVPASISHTVTATYAMAPDTVWMYPIV